LGSLCGPAGILPECVAVRGRDVRVFVVPPTEDPESVMQDRHSTPLLAGLLAITCGLAACGSGQAAPDSDASGRPRGASASDVRSAEAAAREQVADILKQAKASSLDFQAEMRREVPLPSHRRLLAFLPQELPDLPFVTLESEHEQGPGKAEATGRYQLSRAHYRGGIELRVTYYGKAAFNGPGRFFDAALGERVEVSGFPALLVEQDSDGDVEYELHVRISPEVFVQAGGPGSPERVRDAAAAVDLAGLAKAVESELLFEPTREDRLEEAILSRSQLEALIPPALGPQELASVSSVAQLDASPMHSRATGQFGQGQWTLTDYGDAEVAAAVELQPRDDQGFAMRVQRREDEVQEAELEVPDGRGRWAWLGPAEHQPGVLALRAVRGRFVLEYSGPFLPEVELAANLPEGMRAELERANREMGVGVFDSIEEQRDAVLAPFQALDLGI
jgi:hypothetical protein